MKVTFKVLLLLIINIVLLSCTYDDYNTSTDTQKTSSDQITQKKQEKVLRQKEAQVGLPSTPKNTEKKFARDMFELRDKADLVCYAYIWNKMTGKAVFIGRCIGFGLPYSVQYSNPEKIVVNNWAQGSRNTNYDGYAGGLYGTLPQAEPNGLFTPDGLSATWLKLIDEKTGEIDASYWEPEIVVLQKPLNDRLVEGYNWKPKKK